MFLTKAFLKLKVNDFFSVNRQAAREYDTKSLFVCRGGGKGGVLVALETLQSR